MHRPEPAVDVQALSRAFGSFIAVDKISLQVAKGEIFGFLGPNGAGKSTTIRMLCGLLMPTGGGGTVGGYDIRTESEAVKNIIGYMSQRFSLYDDLTVEENINFFGGVYKVPKEKKDSRKAWVLAMAGIEDKKHVLTRTLPTGFKQRLALGCAVLHEPPVLFLDEPTSGVDPLSRRSFWDLIREMAESGTTIFVTTHYMEEADYCDRLALDLQGTDHCGRGAHGAAEALHETGHPGDRDGEHRGGPRSPSQKRDRQRHLRQYPPCHCGRCGNCRPPHKTDSGLFRDRGRANGEGSAVPGRCICDPDRGIMK